MKKSHFFLILTALLPFIFAVSGHTEILTSQPTTILYQQVTSLPDAKPIYKRRIVIDSETLNSDIIPAWSVQVVSKAPLERVLSNNASVTWSARKQEYIYSLTPADPDQVHIDLTTDEDIDINSFTVLLDGVTRKVSYFLLETVDAVTPVPDNKDILKATLVVSDLKPEEDCRCESERTNRPYPNSDCPAAGENAEFNSQFVYNDLLPAQNSHSYLLGENLQFHLQVDDSCQNKEQEQNTGPIPDKGYICLETQKFCGRQAMHNGDEATGGGTGRNICPNFTCIKIEGSTHIHNQEGGRGGSPASASSGGSGNQPNGQPQSREGVLATIAKNPLKSSILTGLSVGATVQEFIIWMVCAAPSQREANEGWWDCVTRINNAETTVISGFVGAAAGLGTLAIIKNKRCFCRLRHAN